MKWNAIRLYPTFVLFILLSQAKTVLQSIIKERRAMKKLFSLSQYVSVKSGTQKQIIFYFYQITKFIQNERRHCILFICCFGKYSLNFYIFAARNNWKQNIASTDLSRVCGENRGELAAIPPWMRQRTESARRAHTTIWQMAIPQRLRHTVLFEMCFWKIWIFLIPICRRTSEKMCLWKQSYNGNILT